MRRIKQKTTDPFFGQKLKQLRTEAGMSRYRLERMSGVFSCGISLIEACKVTPNWETAVKYVDGQWRSKSHPLAIPVWSFMREIGVDVSQLCR